MSNLLTALRRFPRRYWVYYGVIALLAFALGSYLNEAPHPSEEGISARKDADKSVKAEHYMISGLWYGAQVGFGVLVIIALAGPLALRPLGQAFEKHRAGLGRTSTPVFLIMAALAMLLASLQMVPRLDNSLWEDEDYTVRRSVVGQYERKADGELWFREVTWTDTLFGYRKPNNHVLYSVMARLSHAGHEIRDDPQGMHFNELRLRLPALIAGLLAIPSLGYLLATMGFRRASIAAMFLLAVHPWFLRHGCEARGYPLAMALGPFMLTFLIKSLQRGRWRYWAAFALSEFLLFYAYPGTLWILVMANLGALIAIVSTRPRGLWIPVTSRWFSANCFAALPVVFLMAPLLPQLREYMGEDVGGISARFLAENFSHVATGIPWAPWEEGNPLAISLSDRPLLSAVVLVIFYGALLLGSFRLWRSSPRMRWLLIALLLPYLVMLLHIHLSSTRAFSWYTVPTLPLLIALVALGLEYFPSRMKDVRIGTLAGFVTLGVALISLALFAKDQTRQQRKLAIEPLRESVAFTRGIMNPSLPAVSEVITVQFHQGSRGYDPTTYFIKGDKPETLRALLTKADAENKPLWINMGMPALARQIRPGLMALVDDEALFEPQIPLWGQQAPCTRYIFRYLGKDHESRR